MVKPAETSLLSSANVFAYVNVFCQCPYQRLYVPVPVNVYHNPTPTDRYHTTNTINTSLPPLSLLFSSLLLHPMQNTSTKTMKTNPINPMKPINRIKTNPDRRHLPPGWKETYNAQCVFYSLFYSLVYSICSICVINRDSIYQERYMVLHPNNHLPPSRIVFPSLG
ncbi:hypothetical protein F5050DRAFT_1791519 [Lentinula boryana]|uniref:Uncharacterized protein n=1 Tax=Lentinula boryana TaxID=40481 RepID=A0ABQ8PZU0_9AGAR|nr:hypothetical protein F5050DRAFT_1791519 [Lentinula boryana]